MKQVTFLPSSILNHISCHFRLHILSGSHVEQTLMKFPRQLFRLRCYLTIYWDHLLRHFTDNDGSCTLCNGDISSGSIEHLLMHCSAFVSTRKHLLENLKRNKNISERTKSLILSYFRDGKDTVQLLLDGSTLPEIIRIIQTEGNQILHEVFSFSRNWCYTIHRTRLKLQGRWINWKKKYPCVTYLII